MPLIRELNADDVVDIPAVDGGSAWHGGPAKWSVYWDQHRHGLRACFVAVEQDCIVGYASLVWRSQHGPFATAGVPEIQDMVVAESHRGRGVATALAAACEVRALAAGLAEVGIGFGLYADYGAAQRLYVRLGYVPDGGGLTWNNQAVTPGAMVRVDDDLVFWLRKRLR
jgi:GNAT superfamily N-acetyltransferase